MPVLGVYALLSCRSIIGHNFKYLRFSAMDTRTFPRSIRRYWNTVPTTLGISCLIFLFNFWIGLAVSFFLISGMKKNLTRRLQEEYVEGTRLMAHETVSKHYSKQIQPGDPRFWFSGVWLPRHELMTHAKIIGSSGSGKTNNLRLYMQSILRLVGTAGCEDRAIIFDPKSEFYPYFRGLGIPEEYVIILNPFDARACAWHLAADLTRPRDASTLARIMIPEKKEGSGNGEFFDKAARRIFSGLTKFFINHAPGQWTLRDLVLAAQSMELVGLLAASDRKLARDLQVLGAGDTAGNVVATISAVIGNELETIAACMDYHQRQGRSFSLKSWFESSSILLLGCDRESEATLQPYNQLLVTRFCELATSAEHLGVTHAIFDEVPVLGKVGKKLDELARLGRSYNVPLLITFQAYSSLKEIYGENTANSLIGQCDKSAYLRVVDHETAKWASEQFGQVKKRIFLQGTSVTHSTQPDRWGKSVSQGVSVQESYETGPAVRLEDIMNLHKPSKQNGRGVDGFYKVGAHCYHYYLDSAVLSKIAVTDDPLSVGFEPIHIDLDEAEDLREWDEEDLTRLGIIEAIRGVDQNKLKTLPVSEWVQLSFQTAPQEITAILEEVARDKEDKE